MTVSYTVQVQVIDLGSDTPKPERCSWQRGARPSRSLCSASRRTAGATDSVHHLVR